MVSWRYRRGLTGRTDDLERPAVVVKQNSFLEANSVISCPGPDPAGVLPGARGVLVETPGVLVGAAESDAASLSQRPGKASPSHLKAIY